MSKKVLISGYYGFDNFGDEIILSILVNHLKLSNTEITVLSSNPDKTSQTLNINAVNSFNYRDVFKHLLKTDFLISGGGSLLQDVTSLKSLIYYLGLIFIAILFRKQVIIFAQGIGPINNELAKYLTLILLKQCSYISVRDKFSQKFLAENNIKSELVCDPVFSLNIPVLNQKGIVGIQLRNFKTMNDIFLNDLAYNVNKYFYDKKIQILSLQDANDFEISEKFKNILLKINGNLNVEVVCGKTNKEITDFLSKLEYLIGMRFHAILVALKAGVRTIGIDYDIKVRNLATDMGIPLLSLNSKNNYEKVFNDMFSLSADKILTNTKIFNWTTFDKLINAN